MKRWHKILLELVFFVAVWMFWWLKFPHALSFREQNQLLLFTWQYLGERLSLPGGFADYVSEFLLQFSVVMPLGAALVATVFWLIQMEVSALSGGSHPLVYSFSYIPSLLLILYMGDNYAMFVLPVAICLTLALCLYFSGRPSLFSAIIIFAALFWAVGPASWLFVVFAALRLRNAEAAAVLGVIGAFMTIVIFFLLRQYPLQQIVFGVLYYSVPLVHPVLQHISLAVIALLMLMGEFFHNRVTIAFAVVPYAVYAVSLVLCWLFVPLSFNRNIYQIIAFDQLVRSQKWEEVIRKAEEFQPKADIGCVSVNLALFMTGQMERMDEFRQCGTKGLLMPRVRDYISNTSTGEAFWRLGFINEALRYAFDTQEANPSMRKNPRSMMRMAECQILNGRYKVASKYLDILKHTMFYRKWALEEEKYLFDEAGIMKNPLYAYLLSARLEDDYLFYYPQMDRMLSDLYLHNRNNQMAGMYFVKWKKYSNNDIKDEETYSGGVHGN